MSLRTALMFPLATLIPAVARAATGDVVTSFPSSFPSPDGLMWDGSFLWATDCTYSRIDKVDAATGEVVGSIDITGINSDELTWDGTAMWISDHTATEMPQMQAPPPRLYRVDPATQQPSLYFEAPGASKYPMGVAWDGATLWNVDTWDRKLFQLDAQSGAILRELPVQPTGACGLTWDGACLWLTDASTDGRVYHLDAETGEVISSFDGPGGPGHQTTGIAWDGESLFIHDEATGRARIYQVAVDDITEAGRCAGALQKQPDAGADDAGSAGAGGAGSVPASQPDTGQEGGCTTSPRGASGSGGVLAVAAFALLAARARRRAR